MGVRSDHTEQQDAGSGRDEQGRNENKGKTTHLFLHPHPACRSPVWRIPVRWLAGFGKLRTGFFGRAGSRLGVLHDAASGGPADS